VTLSIQFRKANTRRRFHRLSLLTATACLVALLIAATPSMAGVRQLLTGHVPQAVASSRVLDELPRGTPLNLAIGLPLRNQPELDALLVQLSDPSSPNFRRYLTAEQFAAEFGPTEQDYQALIQFARENGLVVTGTHPNRLLLDVSGDVADIERVFHINVLVYRHPVRGDFYAPDSEPSVDLETKILSISGLDNFVVPQPMNLKKATVDKTSPFVTGSGPGGYFIGGDFRAAYAPQVTLTGSGQEVGLLEFDGFYPGDVTKNAAQAGVPVVPTQTVLLDGFSGTPGGDNIEVILDIMMASYMAPGLSKVMVYEGDYANDILNRMATDNLAKQLSSSWGFGINATTEQIYQEFIAQGQSMMQASGDSGAYENGVMTPSDDPNLTVVGGTSLTTSGPGGAWQSESAWSGSGGGASTTYTIPSYQQGVSMAANGGSTKMRNIPDVALLADVQIFLIQSNGQACVVGGTSAATPLWAGFLALANQQAAANSKPSVGFLNPLIYPIGENSSHGADLHDITQGGNGGYSAVPGYDLVTGWGSPTGQHLINDLAGTSSAAGFVLSSSVSALTIKPASTGSATITVAAKNGFKGSVSLSATGMPSGVTAVFTPATTATTSSVTFTASSSAAPGTYPITITGVSGALSSTATISLTVPAPSFTLLASTASLTVPQGGSGSSTITVGGKNGFKGTVTLSATGLPTGVTAVFTPAATATTSSVTLAVSSSVSAGTYPVTITGISGTLSSTATIGLTVVVPSFTLAASTASLTVPRAGSGSSTITISAKNGFKGSVTLSAAGLPSGVTAAFTPASTTSKSSLAFSASSTAATGTYSVVVTGASGTLTATATIALTVTAPNFTLLFQPATLALPPGLTSSGTVTMTAVNGFKGTVTLSASGLPSGVTAAFGALNSSGVSQLTLKATSAAATGSFPITVSGVSGSLTAKASFTLTVVAPTAGTSLVNLSAEYNVNALVMDGLPFTGGGVDGGLNGSPTAYSANLIGVEQSIQGAVFYFGPTNAPDAVSGKAISLPAGQFTSLRLLGTGVNGAELSQVFSVRYTDGTTSTFTQSLSDWFTPQNFHGETVAMSLPYRDNGAGQRDNRTFSLYEYMFPLIAGKTVASITLPNNRNVVVLAIILNAATTSSR
jgi:uncharacterized membrane protein